MIILAFSMKAGLAASSALKTHVREVRRSQQSFNQKLDGIAKERGLDALGKMTIGQIEDYKPKF